MERTTSNRKGLRVLCRHWEQAVEEYRQVIERQPRLIEVRLKLGKILQIMGREAEAIAVYESVLSLLQKVADEASVQPPSIGLGSIVAHADPYFALYVRKGEVIEDFGDEVRVAWEHWKDKPKKTERYFILYKDLFKNQLYVLRKFPENLRNLTEVITVDLR